MSSPSESTPLAQWLGGLGLSCYADSFAENDVDWQVLPRLDHASLKEIGVASVGHRIRLLEAIAALQPAPPEVVRNATRDAGPDDAERRQLTVMFCDVVGSTELATRLDPEILRDVIRAFQRAVEGAIEAFGGRVAQLLGDGVLVYFGVPVAHEDDAQRAVHAALALPHALQALNERLDIEHGVRLVVRTGIHTGPVVVGEMGGAQRSERLATGETPNVAARLQAAAEPGTIVISESTRRLVAPWFELGALGDLALKGLATPVPAFRVDGERGGETRYASMHPSRSPMVGRSHEFALLRERWHQARGGHGLAVVLSGEAGIGKSCLTRALIDAIAADDHQCLSYQCSPFHSGVALHPVLRQLMHAARADASDDEAVRRDKLTSCLAQQQVATDVATLLAGLMGLGDAPPSSHAAEDTTGHVPKQGVGHAPEHRIGHAPEGTSEVAPGQRRERALRALLSVLQRTAQRHPVLVLIEDAHWIDPTTLKLVEMALERIERQRIMILITARPSFAAPFGSFRAVSHLSLARLGHESVGAIVQRLTHGKALPPELLDEIVVKTDGVPLFVEELTKSLLESGQLRDDGAAYRFEGRLDRLSIPNSLQDALMARLDRVRDLREVAQTAACIGREFSGALLAAVSPLPAPALAQALKRLVDAEVVFQRSAAPDVTYTFKHALLRDAAHESQLRSRRAAIHERLLAHLSQDDGVPPELLAQHAAEAGLQAEAARHWEEAGARSVARSMFIEAIGHFEHALAYVRAQPPSTGGDSRMRVLRLELRLAHACVSGLGHGNALTAQAFKRAHGLADALVGAEAATLRFAAYYGLSVTQLVRCELDEAASVARTLMRTAEDTGEPVQRLMAHCCSATVAVLRGGFGEAHERFERVRELHAQVTTTALIGQFGHDPRGVASSYHAVALWCLGQTAQAEATWREAMQLALASGHAPSQAQPRAIGALLAILARADDAQVEARTCDALRFAEQHHFQMWRGVATCLRGWSELVRGDAQTALVSARRGRELLHAGGTQFLGPLVALTEARALCATGDHAAALGVLHGAQRHQDASGEHWLAAEVWRMIGDVLCDSGRGDAPEAEGAYRQALQIARTQSAHAWELRAAVGLAALWVQQERHGEARDLLLDVRSRWPSGLTTADALDLQRLLMTLQTP